MSTASVPEFDLSLAKSGRRLADVLVDVLADAGVDVVFGLPGGTIAPVFDALLDRPEIRVVTTRHETSAMFAAAGYARTTGKLGVVMVTSGPGMTNAITGLASAWCDGIPVLLLAGEVPRKVFGRAALQEGTPYHLDVIGMARTISKLAIQLHEPNAAPAMLRRAIATAMSGRRGPVTLTLPVDVAATTVVEPEVSLGVSTSFSIEAAAVERAASALAPAPGKRRLIFAGAGVRFGKGTERLRAFAEQLQIPVMTTPKGKGVFPEGHPLSLGVFGIGGHPSALRYVEEGIDVMLAIGTSLGELGTNGWSPLLIPRQSLIHVDVETNQMGKSYAPTHYIAAPAEVFLETLAMRMPKSAERAWFGVDYHTDPKEAAVGGEGRITPQRALWEIQQVLPRDTIFACDVGEHSVFATHYIRTNHPDGFILMNGLGSMGQSLGAGIGAQIGKPKRRTAVICGDGGFLMVAGELATAVSERLPLTVFIFNDQRLGMVEIGNNAIYGRTPKYPVDNIDIAAMARALGARSLVVEHPGEILALGPHRDFDGPLLVEILIDRTERMPRNGRFEALGNAQRQTKLSEIK